MRVVVERAFGMLKGRWKILAKKNEQHFKSVSQTITAACVLHNFCQMQGERYDEDVRDPPRQHNFELPYCRRGSLGNCGNCQWND